MKKYIINISFVLLAILTIVACDDNDYSYPSGGTPVVEYVRPTNVDSADVRLDGTYLGRQIAIVGHGFAGVNKVYFNDIKAKLNPNFVTESTIIVTVPNEIPNVREDLLKLYTSEDSCYYDFETRVPAPSLSSMSFEYAAVGDQVTLSGSYFVDDPGTPLSVTFTGGVEAEIVSNEDLNTMEIVVPEGAQQGPVTVATAYGEGVSLFNYLEPNGIFVDEENPSSWNYWALSGFDDVDGFDGQYVKFEGTSGGWAWPAPSLQFYYVNSSTTSLIPEGDIFDYALKFECKVNKWNDIPLIIWFDNTQAHKNDGDEAKYLWKPYTAAEDGEYVTERWITVELPLEDFIYSYDEQDNKRMISREELVNLNMLFFGPAQEETTDFGIDVSIDNIRLVRIKEAEEVVAE